jgi:hypothetical protein
VSASLLINIIINHQLDSRVGGEDNGVIEVVVDEFQEYFPLFLDVSELEFWVDSVETAVGQQDL